MALSSALFTGLSGLDTTQQWLNVVGNNIANANTTAFKSSTVAFTPQFYVTDTPSTAPTSTFGGTNPSQEGTGAQVSSISKDFNAGQIQNTGVATNMAISGDGFFVTQGPNGQQFTRDGTFKLNSNDQLVNSAGDYVQGYAADANGNIISGGLQNITIPLGAQTEAKATTNATLQGNLDANGVVASGSTILSSQAFTTSGGTAPISTSLLSSLVTTAATPAPLFNVGDTLTLAGTRGSRQLPSQSFTVTATSTLTDLENFTNQALQIDTTVSEPGNPTPGATLQTTGTTAQFTVIGNTGTQNTLTMGATGLTDSTTGTNPLTMNPGTSGTFTNNPAGESTHTTINAYDSLGTPITVDVTSVLESKTTAGSTWRFYATSPDNNGIAGDILGNGTVSFGPTGQFLSSAGNQISIDRSASAAQSPLNITLDFSAMTGFTSPTSNMVMSNQNGEPIGTLNSFSVGGDGTVTGQYSNGLTKNVGQVVLASFSNPEGLLDQGGNMFEQGSDSGPAIIGAATTNGTGKIESGSLEQSNVNLSREFINLIMASTGFQASSKVISTSNSLLTDLLNIQR